MKHLKGKGEVTYDYKYDMLTYRTKGREYSHSLEFSNFIADIDTEDFVAGVRIMDASNVLGLPKYALKNIQHGTFHAEKTDDEIMIELALTTAMRNKEHPLKEKSTQIHQPAPTDMPNSLVEARIAA